MMWFWLAWERFSIVRKSRGVIPDVLTAAEELAIRVAIADPLNLRDIESLDPGLYRAMRDLTDAIMPGMPARVIEGEVE